MKYGKSAFVCRKCKQVYSIATEVPLNGAICPQCNLQMHYIGVTTDTWNKFTEDEKVILKEKVIDDYRSPQTMYITKMSNDVGTIKNILVFYLVLSIIGGIVWAMTALG